MGIRDRQGLSPAAPAQNRTVTPPECDKLRRLEAYLSDKAEEKDEMCIRDRETSWYTGGMGKRWWWSPGGITASG